MVAPGLSLIRRARRSERGIALLATLLAIALMTILVVDFATSPFTIAVSADFLPFSIASTMSRTIAVRLARDSR